MKIKLFNIKSLFFICEMKCLLGVMLCTTPFQSNAQEIITEEIVAEQIVIHTDRQLYTNGETIWFKLYTLQSGTAISNYSEVAYLELLNAEGAAISRIKVLLENGLGPGAIELPSTMNSGVYTIRAYTRGMRNGSSKKFGTMELFILNPKQAMVRAIDAQNFAGEVEIFNPASSSLNVSTDKTLNIAIATSKSEYRQREKIILEVNTKDYVGTPLPAHLSLSVVLSGPSNTELFPSASMSQNVEEYSNKSLRYLPENRGMRIHGEVVREGTVLGVEGVDVILAFPGTRALVYNTLTDQEGGFSFLLPKMFGLKPIVIQIGEKAGLNLEVQLGEEFHPTELKDSSPTIVLPTEWEDFANRVMENAQIRQAYQAFEPQPTFITPNQFQGISFFGQPDFTYQLDDFTRFPLPEFFYEVVPNVRVRGKFGAEELSVINAWDNLPGNLYPLLLVDGVPVFNQRTFLKINNKLIKSSEIVLSPIWLNPGVFNGVIQISSFEGDARCFELPETALRRSYLTFLPQQQFTSPTYEDKAAGSMPDFRNTLYWNPSIETDTLGRATLEFFSSDALGAFEIRVEGVSKHGQYFGGQSAAIEVVKAIK